MIPKIKLYPFTSSVSHVPMLARLVVRGQIYGLNFGLVHDNDEPLVEFYDRRYDHTLLGQFISRYYLRTLIEREHAVALSLDGGILNWTISHNDLQEALAYLIHN